MLPVSESRRGLAVIARREQSRSRNRFVLCYGFAWDFGRDPTADELRALEPCEASLVGIVGDDQVRAGAWRIVGVMPQFDRRKWKLPLFARFRMLVDEFVAVERDDRTLAEIREAGVISRAEASLMPDDITYGSIAFAQVLERAIEGGWRGRRPIDEIHVWRSAAPGSTAAAETALCTGRSCDGRWKVPVPGTRA